MRLYENANTRCGVVWWWEQGESKMDVSQVSIYIFGIRIKPTKEMG